jgi:hypothetical protein
MRLSTLELLHDLEEYFDKAQHSYGEDLVFLSRVQTELRAETGDEEE